jgi:hypothetical protein
MDKEGMPEEVWVGRRPNELTVSVPDVNGMLRGEVEYVRKDLTETPTSEESGKVLEEIKYITDDPLDAEIDRDYLVDVGSSFIRHIKTIRKALTAQKEEEWQPIETAPKDGTEVDCFHARSLLRVMDCIWPDSEWFSKYLEVSLKHINAEDVTHWKPLDEPTKQEGE